jgi:hypothetical protein
MRGFVHPSKVTVARFRTLRVEGAFRGGRAREQTLSIARS